MDSHDCDELCFHPIQVGSPAPEFRCEAFVNGNFEHLALEDFKGKWVVLFFYPLDFTFVCPTEILEFNKHAKDFTKENAQLLGISIDSVYSHQAWGKELGALNFPLLSDITKEISMDYGVLLEDKGIALRGTFIIDPDGILRHVTVNDLPIGRSVTETLRVLHAAQSGELCPVGWEKGGKTLGKA
ncbi:MAG: peroxiredoxin [bacterium]|nr:peroxiredoxin [bacterium]